MWGGHRPESISSRPAGTKDDVENAGARLLDEPAVVDGALVSARYPRNLSAFAKAMLEVLGKQR